MMRERGAPAEENGFTAGIYAAVWESGISHTGRFLRILFSHAHDDPVLHKLPPKGDHAPRHPLTVHSTRETHSHSDPGYSREPRRPIRRDGR